MLIVQQLEIATTAMICSEMRDWNAPGNNETM